MDEVTKKWHFYCWIESREEKAKFMKDLSCFIGSFYNPEMAKKIRDMENDKQYDAGEEGFDAATKLIENKIKDRKTEVVSTRRRKKISIIR